MKRVLLSLLGLLGLSAAVSCGPTSSELAILKHSSFTYPYSQPLTLYVALERDRSGRDYFGAMEEFELATFQERLHRGLRNRKLTLETYTDLGNPVTASLRNPFTVVLDSTVADFILYLRIDGFEDEQVEVTRDRVILWHGYGYTQYGAGYDRVPRAVVALDAQLKETRTGQIFFGFQARGISVGTRFKREAYAVAMDRCEIRFYEKLLRR